LDGPRIAQRLHKTGIDMVSVKRHWLSIFSSLSTTPAPE
jgi:hypothetical protein